MVKVFSGSVSSPAAVATTPLLSTPPDRPQSTSPCGPTCWRIRVTDSSITFSGVQVPWQPQMSSTKFRRIWAPSGVCTTSGWNCTPNTGSVRWRRPMMVPSSVQAVGTSTSGSEAASTIRLW